MFELAHTKIYQLFGLPIEVVPNLELEDKRRKLILTYAKCEINLALNTCLQQGAPATTERCGFDVTASEGLLPVCNVVAFTDSSAPSARQKLILSNAQREINDILQEEGLI